MAITSGLEPRELSQLTELMKVSGSNYLLIDNGSESLKVSIDTLLGYLSGEILAAAMPIPLAYPVGTLVTCKAQNMEGKLALCFGGAWTYKYSTVVSGATEYTYEKTSGTDSASMAGLSAKSGGSGSGLVVIPEGVNLPAASRQDGTYYINVLDIRDAQLLNSGTVTSSTNLGLKMIE